LYDAQRIRGTRARRFIGPQAAALALLAGTIVAAGALAQAPVGKSSWTLDSILKQLDEESKSFRSLTASIERVKVTVVVNDRSVETGSISLRRDDKMLIELNPPDSRTVLRNGDKLFIFQPRLKRVEEYDLGKHRGQLDQFMLLGFGTDEGELKKHYLATFQGEQVLDGKKVVLLELTPKDPKVRGQISRIHLWVDLANWLPVQQRFYETGSGDHFTIHYTNVMRNPRLPDSRFKPAWPKGVTRVKPQGQ
jgi:outer membrane lipoprotein-sorting protein